MIDLRVAALKKTCESVSIPIPSCGANAAFASIRRQPSVRGATVAIARCSPVVSHPLGPYHMKLHDTLRPMSTLYGIVALLC